MEEGENRHGVLANGKCGKEGTQGKRFRYGRVSGGNGMQIVKRGPSTPADEARSEEFTRQWQQILAAEPSYQAQTLRGYFPSGSAEVYGEVGRDFVRAMVEEACIGPDDVFYDLGAGVGNVLVQVAALTGCRCVGVEIRPELVAIGQRLIPEALKALRESGFAPNLTDSQVTLLCGDAAADDPVLTDATVVYVCNLAFTMPLENRILVKLNEQLAQGTRVTSLRDFAPRYRRLEGKRSAETSLGPRGDLLAVFRCPWRCFEIEGETSSWTSHAIRLFVYEVDRTGGTMDPVLPPLLLENVDVVPAQEDDAALALAKKKKSKKATEVETQSEPLAPAENALGNAFQVVKSDEKEAVTDIGREDTVVEAATAEVGVLVKFPEIAQLQELFPHLSKEDAHRILYYVGYDLTQACDHVLHGSQSSNPHFVKLLN